MKNFIAYYRVSTQKQGASGLGLEAQKAQAEAFAKGRGLIVAEFVEVESGKRNDRPKLAEAIEQTKATGGTLLIAKLDRLARNAGFIFALRDARVDFQAADLPDANTLTIGIFATMAQHEREVISQRTKAALAARRARGLNLGNPANLTEEARRKGPATLKQIARGHKANRQAAELARLYRAQGMSLEAIAERLNKGAYATRNGKRFHRETVRRLLAMPVQAEPVAGND